MSARFPLAVVVIGLVLSGGCAKPIEMALYSRTPLATRPLQPVRPVGNLRIGVAGDGPTSAAFGAEFVRYAANRTPFAAVEWATAANIGQISYLVECLITYEHSGNAQVHY